MRRLRLISWLSSPGVAIGPWRKPLQRSAANQNFACDFRRGIKNMHAVKQERAPLCDISPNLPISSVMLRPWVMPTIRQDLGYVFWALIVTYQLDGLVQDCSTNFSCYLVPSTNYLHCLDSRLFTTIQEARGWHTGGSTRLFTLGGSSKLLSAHTPTRDQDPYRRQRSTIFIGLVHVPLY